MLQFDGQQGVFDQIKDDPMIAGRWPPRGRGSHDAEQPAQWRGSETSCSRLPEHQNQGRETGRRASEHAAKSIRAANVRAGPRGGAGTESTRSEAP